jgi:hypothetical protein
VKIRKTRHGALKSYRVLPTTLLDETSLLFHKRLGATTGTVFWENALCFCGLRICQILDFVNFVATSICAFRYEATAAIFKKAYAVRKTLGFDLIRLVNLISFWAAFRFLGQRIGRFEPSPRIYNAWLNRMAIAFIYEKLYTKIVSWPRIDQFVFRVVDRFLDRYTKVESALDNAGREDIQSSSVQMRHSRRRIGPHIDFELLHKTFAVVLADPLSSSDAHDRGFQILILKEVLSCFLASFSVPPETGMDNDEIDGTPYDSDRWTLDCVCRRVKEMTIEERPEQFWMPLLDLGCGAHYWVEDFCNSWFSEARDDKSNYEPFVEIWRRMIAYCIESRKWTEEQQSANHLGDMWAALMGLESGGEMLFSNQSLAPVLLRMFQHYDAFAEKWKHDSWMVEKLARFLYWPAATTIRVRALPWIECVVHDGASNRLDAAVARLLKLCWTNHRNDFEKSSESRQLFLRMLAAIAARSSESRGNEFTR